MDCKKEVLELFKDKLWRLNNLYYIVNEAGEKELFKMRDAQYEFFTQMHDKNLILKARQLGFSTLTDLDMLDDCLFRSNTEAAIIAQTLNDVKKIFQTKVKYPWDHLHPDLKSKFKETTDSKNELSWNNGSSIRVATSVRSATMKRLHISEFGKICAKFPERAREIVTGCLNSLHQGSIVTIESTAEGEEGYFFDYCKKARDMQDAKKQLTWMDYKFHFFPWYREKSYRLEADFSIPIDLEEYFEILQINEGIALDECQKRWYVKKWSELGDDMFREHPSTPDEAFKSTKDGKIFAKEIAKIRRNGQIMRIPFDENLPVYTGFDLGVSDPTCIWFAQKHGPFKRLIDYYEADGEGLAHFVNVLTDKAERFGYRYKVHYLPHDARVRELSHKKLYSRQQVLEEEYGLNIEVMERIASEGDGIELTRRAIPSLWIDEVNCERGIKCLDAYQREYDHNRGCYRDRPFHNWASHGVKALETLLLGFAKEEQVKEGMSAEEIYAMNAKHAGDSSFLF